MKNLNQLICDPQRIAAVTRTGLLDTGPEQAFDRLTRLAARSLDAPVALVSLRDTHRHYFESAIGLPEPWAVFTVSLPLVTSNSDSLDTAAAPPETAADSPATQPNLRGLRILGVDDEADALDGLRLFFEQHQGEVRTASCANELSFAHELATGHLDQRRRHARRRRFHPDAAAARHRNVASTFAYTRDRTDRLCTGGRSVTGIECRLSTTCLEAGRLRRATARRRHPDDIYRQQQS